MNPDELKNLPYRLSERSFRKYEDIIAEAVRVFPATCEITPVGNRSVFVARLRDAITSLSRYHWTTKVNMEVFANQRLVVYDTGKKIWTGAEYNDNNNAYVQAVLAHGIPPFETTWIDYEVVETICQLAAARCLSRPIKTTSIDKSDADALEQSYDVRIDQQPDGSFVIQ